MAFSADYTHILGLNFLMSQNVNVPFPSLPGEEQVCPFGDALQQRGFSPCFQMRMLDLSNRMQVNSLSLPVGPEVRRRVWLSRRLHAG